MVGRPSSAGIPIDEKYTSCMAPTHLRSTETKKTSLLEATRLHNSINYRTWLLSEGRVSLAVGKWCAGWWWGETRNWKNRHVAVPCALICLPRREKENWENNRVVMRIEQKTGEIIIKVNK